MHPFSSGSFTTRGLTSPIRLPILAHVPGITLDAAYNPASFMSYSYSSNNDGGCYISLLFRLGHENYVLTSRLQEGREGCRNGSKTRIDRGRERERENECMTPAYCARSNDIRVIIPASRECLLTLDAQDIFSPYCTLSSNAVLIKARS